MTLKFQLTTKQKMRSTSQYQKLLRFKYLIRNETEPPQSIICEETKFALNPEHTNINSLKKKRNKITFKCPTNRQIGTNMEDLLT